MLIFFPYHDCEVITMLKYRFTSKFNILIYQVLVRIPIVYDLVNGKIENCCFVKNYITTHITFANYKNLKNPCFCF